MKPIPVSIPTLPTSLEVHIGHHLLETDLLPTLCKEYGNQTIILTDSTVHQLYAKQLSSLLGAQIFEVPVGEKAKTREVKQNIEDQMLQEGYGRHTVVIGLGGGSITDLAGFLASTYLRGVPLILVPTTLLAMVDASIGGKTAVNTELGKNLIGTFYHPKAIVSDLNMLKTLPKKEEVNGLAEIIKMGLIYDAEILNLQMPLEELVKKAVRAKIDIVQQDPFEKNGLRRILNFGHTIAHALETVSDYSLAHGQAVAMGCCAESYLSAHLGYLSKEEFLSIEHLYQSHFASLQLPKGYTQGALLKALQADKKKSAQGVRCVLLDKIGQVLPFEGEYCLKVSEKDLIEAFLYLERSYGI